MGTVNRMSSLLDKIERRLGIKWLMDGMESLDKDHWVDVIMSDTMDTFSRYFPNKIKIYLNSETVRFANDCYLINEELLDPLDIIGVGDIEWTDNFNSNNYNAYGGLYDIFSAPLGIYDIGLAQTSLDMSSLFNLGIYVKFEEPNMLKVEGVINRDMLKGIKNLPLNIFVKHKTLSTISPTKMEIFEKLAICDVAKYVIGEVKYFDDYDTNFGNIDLKLDDLRSVAEQRDSIIEELENGYVNPANKAQPMIMTI